MCHHPLPPAPGQADSGLNPGEAESLAAFLEARLEYGQTFERHKLVAGEIDEAHGTDGGGKARILTSGAATT